MDKKYEMKYASQIVRGNFHSDPQTGSIVPAIYQTATYVLDSIGNDKGFDYTRSSNPTRHRLEEHLSLIEGSNYGVSYSSGMAACDSVFRMLKAGDHIICSKDLYGGVTRLLDQSYTSFGVEVDYVDVSSASSLDRALKSNTKMIWVETPSNPLLEVIDLNLISSFANSNDLISVVDSTFATPYLLKPIEYQIDMVVQSTSKYISGHNQLIGGAVLTNSEELFKRLKFFQKSIGAVQSPFDCYLTLLGVKTLELRMDRHCENAMKVAQFLAESKMVKRVIYPGLPNHEQHSIAKEQMKNYGGMLSFELETSFEKTKEFINKLEFCMLAESLGGTETMITHPASMTHLDVPKEVRIRRGLTDTLCRLSVGIEDVEDIIMDLDRALASI